MSATERIPPYNKEAEIAVVGAILLNNDALSKVRGSIETEDFYIEAYRRIYSAMIDLSMKGEPIDHVTVGNELIKRGELEKIGGPMALDDLTSGVGTVGNVRYYADIVRKKAARRRMIYTAQQIVADGFSNHDEEEEYLSAARVSVAQAAQFTTSKGPQKIDGDIKILYKYLEEKGDPPGLVKTGIEVIDQNTGGLWPGILYTVAARPSMGKSAFALNIATNVALMDKKVLFITLEDVRQFAAMRMTARMADIDMNDLLLRKVNSQEQWRRLIDAANRMANRPIWFDDSPGLTSMAIAQIAASHKATHGLDLLMIDHLGEVADEGESETSIAGRAAMRFRDVAKELDIPVVEMCQLNRKVEDRSDKRPLLSDLRQSGRIEEASRVVWFLYRPAYYMNDEDAEGRMDLHLLQAKASHGKTGLMKMWVDLSRMYTRSWDVGIDGLWPESDTSSGATGKVKDYFGNKKPEKSEPHWQDKKDW